MRKKIIILLTIFTLTTTAHAFESKTGITGVIEWDTLKLNAEVSLDLASADIRLPSGRTRGETIINREYVRLLRTSLMGLQVDSSSTLADLINRGELTLSDANNLVAKARSVPASLTPDLKNMKVSYSLDIRSISKALLRHNRANSVMRALNVVPAADYTGIIIIATEELPVHGLRTSALPIPCLFPKIWDSEMNLIFNKSMFETNKSISGETIESAEGGAAVITRYSHKSSIFDNHPSGISPELRDVVGERPLRIFASGVFGESPTDLIIAREDALRIISSEQNRRLLSQGRVVFILNDSVLKQEFSF